jgi:hypothetical protein
MPMFSMMVAEIVFVVVVVVVVVFGKYMDLDAFSTACFEINNLQACTRGSSSLGRGWIYTVIVSNAL